MQAKPPILQRFKMPRPKIVAIQFGLGILYLIFAEFSFRSVLAITNKEPRLLNPFENHSWRWSSLKSLNLTILNPKKTEGKKSEIRKPIQPGAEGANIVAFGGSTTYGKICPGSLSAWAYFASQSIGIKIVNKSMPMTNSDYALYKLKQLLDSGERPDVVLWANKPNEINPLFFGFDLNPDIPGKLGLKTVGDNSVLPSISLALARVAKTLAKESFLYSYLDTVLEEASNRNSSAATPYTPLRYTPKAYKPTDLSSYNSETLSLVQEGTLLHQAAMDNYLTNLKTLAALSRKYGFNVLLVSLPMALDFPGQPKTKEDFRNIPRGIYSTAIRENPDFAFLELRDIYSDQDHSSENIKSYYCDAMHQTDQGHSLTGKAFADGYRKLSMPDSSI